jgi:hypothetical protein
LTLGRGRPEADLDRLWRTWRVRPGPRSGVGRMSIKWSGAPSQRQCDRFLITPAGPTLLISPVGPGQEGGLPCGPQRRRPERRIRCGCHAVARPPAMTRPKSVVPGTTTVSASNAARILAGRDLAGRGDRGRITSRMPSAPSSHRAAGVGATASSSRTPPRSTWLPSSPRCRPWQRCRQSGVSSRRPRTGSAVARRRGSRRGFGRHPSDARRTEGSLPGRVACMNHGQGLGLGMPMFSTASPGRRW